MIGIHIRRTDGDFVKINWDKTDAKLMQKLDDELKRMIN